MLLILIVTTAYSVSVIGDVCVSAAITGEVWTSKTPGGPAEIFFNPNETVYINWLTNPANSKVTINITDSDLNLVATVATDITGPSPQTWVAGPAGAYWVWVWDANGNQKVPVTSSSLSVVPESALGTIALIGATFAGFGLVKYRKNKLN